MPTGYTAKLATGEQAVADYIAACARSMMFMVTMRDLPLDTSLPEKFEPSDYHKLQIEKTRVQIKELEATTDEALAAACDAYFAQKEADANEYNQKRIAQKERYYATLEKVQAWSPEHPVMQSLRSFAVQQLQSSIDFDCGGDVAAPPERIAPEAWKAERLIQFRKSLDYHTGEYERECERVAERNECLKELRRELEALTPQSAR